MIIFVHVIPGAKRNIIRREKEVWKVHLQDPAVEGKANKSLVEFLAENFKVKRRQIAIIKGLKSRDKIVKIGD